mmetsp:Transcript_14672/g.40533  ORF Transcript_14672/g.40533 Transcript_14672/m.40533 type:complete len:206 (-) Transcript_14672:48-665(-)
MCHAHQEVDECIPPSDHSMPGCLFRIPREEEVLAHATFANAVHGIVEHGLAGEAAPHERLEVAESGSMRDEDVKDQSCLGHLFLAVAAVAADNGRLAFCGPALIRSSARNIVGASLRIFDDTRIKTKRFEMPHRFPHPPKRRCLQTVLLIALGRLWHRRRYFRLCLALTLEVCSIHGFDVVLKYYAIFVMEKFGCDTMNLSNECS